MQNRTTSSPIVIEISVILTVFFFSKIEYNIYTLFRATTNGVFLFLSKFIDSIVCGSRPCMMSTTRIAMSHNVEPRERKLLKQNISP